MAKLVVTNTTRDLIFEVLGGVNTFTNYDKLSWMQQAFYTNNFVTDSQDFPPSQLLIYSSNKTDSRVDLKWTTRMESGRKVMVTTNGISGTQQMSYPVLANLDGRALAIGYNTNNITPPRDGMKNCAYQSLIIAPKDRQWIMLINEIKITIQGDGEV